MHGNKPSRKKVPSVVGAPLIQYLQRYGRAHKLPIQYGDMGRFMQAVPLLDASGNDTLWQTVHYEHREAADIHAACCELYALLKTDGDLAVIDHLSVARIDYCLFGNTHPYRVRIINKINDNYDHFYIKRVDASRIYGLELEELLSPNVISYLYDMETIVEEHIAGIPGDAFMQRFLDVDQFEKIRIAKEFVKFNERCFARLLGDMRSYNYVVDVTPDIEGNQYRLRAIDFDQQSYEGRKSFYLPQYFKDNNSIINLGIQLMTSESVVQYQLEERSLIARRARSEQERLSALLRVMKQDVIAPQANVEQLRLDLSKHHGVDAFAACQTMGDLVYVSINLLLQKEFKQSIMEVG